MEVRKVALPPAPENPIELAAHALASRMADEEDACTAYQIVQRQVEDKQGVFRSAVNDRDEYARQVQDAKARATDRAQQLATEQALIAPLQAADRLARSKVFDEEADFKQCDMSVSAFGASVADLNESKCRLTRQRDALQAELDREVSLLPTQLNALTQRLRRQGEAYLLSQTIERAQQREERERARERYGALCQVFSQQSESQRESSYAHKAMSYVETVIAVRLELAESEGLARQSSLRGQLAGVEESLALKQREHERQQQYLDEAWKEYDAKQSALQLARNAQSRTNTALRGAEEQVAARLAEMLAAQQEAAALQPAMAAAEAKVQAASSQVDRWVEKLANSQEQLKQARASTRDARTTLFAQKAAAESSGGLLTAAHRQY
jgi:hypothetical protein